MAQIHYANSPLLIGDPVSFSMGYVGVLVAQPEGYAVQKPNGKYLSVKPDGGYKEESTVGAWETFYPDSKLNVLQVNSWIGDNEFTVPLQIPYHG